MPRDIPVGNGQMLVTFDQHYQIRDIYYPHVGQENHAGGGPCRFGVWTQIPQHASAGDRRKKRLYWTSQGWDIHLDYVKDTLATNVTMRHDTIAVKLRCSDVMDFHRPLLVRKIEVTNQADEERDVHLFHHQDFHMFGTKVGDTAYYDPQLNAMVHYREKRYLMTTWHDGTNMIVDEYATGTAGFNGAEGTWRDAEDGKLGNNPIAQGAVDSTMMLRLHMKPHETQVVYMLIGAGLDYNDLYELQQFISREGPQGVIDRTSAYWRLWLTASRTQFPDVEEGGPAPHIIDLFKRSLLIVRTQIDNSGAIIAANDSDIMQFSRDTYSYLWPRDGALVAAALDSAGFPDVARSFYALCSKIITDYGYFLHKYNPDGSLASSWHPWISNGKPQLPIQEDETALVLWALWRHYVRYRDIEFVRPLWMHLIMPAADFLVRYRDPATHLPLPSYDLWEERWGVHAFTVSTVYGGLQAAWHFATSFGDTRRAEIYAKAAEQTREAFCKHMWSAEHNRFLRRIVPKDHDRTAELIGQILDSREPPMSRARKVRSVPAELLNPFEDTSRHNGHDVEFEHDPIIDSSLFAIFSMGMLDAHDPRVESTMHAVEQRLWVKTPVGGVARYENDYYHRMCDDIQGVPGNPWYICTLWLAEWYIAKATNPQELRKALPIFDWVASHALPSGVLAEQVHPHTNAPLSVSPLTWSHATVVSTIVGYLEKLQSMNACPTCGQPRQCVIHNHTDTRTRRSRKPGSTPTHV